MTCVILCFIVHLKSSYEPFPDVIFVHVYCITGQSGFRCRCHSIQICICTLRWTHVAASILSTKPSIGWWIDKSEWEKNIVWPTDNIEKLGYSIHEILSKKILEVGQKTKLVTGGRFRIFFCFFVATDWLTVKTGLTHVLKVCL